MDVLDAIKVRHSVRSYTDRKIEGEILDKLKSAIKDCNQKGKLNIQLCLNEPKAFSGMMARYGKFDNVKNYLALVGKRGPDLEEKCGYYGERIVIKAAQLGLNTCWVANSYKKGSAEAIVNSGEKLLMLIVVGYGANQGQKHRVKQISELCETPGNMPYWFKRGMEAAQLAPTSMNQQRFKFILDEDGRTVIARAGNGFYAKTDLGIAKCHFEMGAGKGDWSWATL